MQVSSCAIKILRQYFNIEEYPQDYDAKKLNRKNKKSVQRN